MLLILLFAIQVRSYSCVCGSNRGVITYKNCEIFLSAAFYYAAQSRNDTLINFTIKLSPRGRDISDTDTLILRTVTRNTDV